MHQIEINAMRRGMVVREDLDDEEYIVVNTKSTFFRGVWLQSLNDGNQIEIGGDPAYCGTWIFIKEIE